MNQPRRLYQMFSTVYDERNDEESITGHKSVDLALKELDSYDLRKLMVHIRTWNANIKLHQLLKEFCMHY